MKDVYRKVNILLKYKMGVDNPEELSSEDRNKIYADYLFLRRYDRDFQLNILKQAISEALGDTNDE